MTELEACIVNHNTSAFAELALRSFAAMHPADRPSTSSRLWIIDNHSEDGVAELEAAAAQLGAAFIMSRWPAGEARVNTHGDVLRDFVLAHQDADYFLFLDADVMFDHPNTVWTMIDELDAAPPEVWAIQARYHWIEANVGAGASLDVWSGHHQRIWASVEAPPEGFFEGLHKPRCNPFCAVIRNSDVFLRVATTLGLSASVVISQDETVGGFADTLGLASLALATHGLRYELSSMAVTHFAGVTHLDPEEEIVPKRRECARLLQAYRAGSIPAGAGPWS